ncbi:hypothetical protein P9173_09190 [Bacillus safensis]|uniref:hypothetical protein n=1 Tax=Bacillus safensis TaxID=561879 RepID=UPI002283285F|nr:hypothetical protein [Bacillus safensis]MCY7542525.1 hypothetical protein [Bacillus safensis]MCY7552400.1 hypothetical protein [Bacillus safensis]MCY7644831.1 hypothetical protein [Bacillus safensis]MCY7655854.1 hypothetical protein [Bacillus safensis]MEC3710328.1 hypothetical protein [Bacillus safensis]
MDDQVLKVIEELDKEVTEGLKAVFKRLDNIENFLTHFEENEPQLKQIQLLENKVELLNKRLLEVESRLNND